MNGFWKSHLRYFVSAFLAVCMIFGTCSFPEADISAYTVKADAAVSETAYNSAVKKIADAAAEKEDSADLSSLGIPSAYCEELYYDALFENPELFYMSASYSLSSSNGTVSSVKLSYSSLYDISGKNFVLSKTVDAFADSYISYKMNVAEKYLAVFEYLIANVSPNDDDLIISEFGSSAYGALVEGAADSLGYALAFKLLSESVGLNSIIIFNSDKTSFWNAVEIDGSYFYIDVYEADDEFSMLLGSTGSYVSTVDHFMFLSDSTSFKLLGHPAGSNYGYGDPISVKGSAELKYERFWNSIKSQMVYYDGYWYCISNNVGSRLLKRSPDVDIVGTKEYPFYINSDLIGQIMSDYKYIYFTNLDAELYALDLLTGEVTEVYDAYNSSLKIRNIYYNGYCIEALIVNSQGSVINTLYVSGISIIKNGTPACSKGDLNGDGKVNLSDLSIVSDYIKNGTSIANSYIGNADINEDGIIDALDRAYIARYIAGESYIINTLFK